MSCTVYETTIYSLDVGRAALLAYGEYVADQGLGTGYRWVARYLSLTRPLDGDDIVEHATFQDFKLEN